MPIHNKINCEYLRCSKRFCLSLFCPSGCGARKKEKFSEWKCCLYLDRLWSGFCSLV